MALSVLISEKIYLAAKAAGTSAGRDVPEQIEHWVRLGQISEAAPQSIKPSPPRKKAGAGKTDAAS